MSKQQPLPHFSEDFGPRRPLLCGAEIDLNACALARLGLEILSQNRSPLLDPERCNQFVAELHQAQGLLWSYGGYMEDRSALWKGSYLEDRPHKPFMHVGVDVNLPRSFPVSLACKIEVLLTGDDHDPVGGWGPHVIGEIVDDPLKGVVLLAHLQHVTCKVGSLLPAHTDFAEVGSATANGGWYDHIHVQRLADSFFSALQAVDPELGTLDGYYPRAALLKLVRDFPNPLSIIPLENFDRQMGSFH